MKNLISSIWLTFLLIPLIVCAFLGESRIRARAQTDDVAAERAAKAGAQVEALANAIEQYYVDFPDTKRWLNDRDGVDRLGGNNSKSTRYLKIDKYSRDSMGRLLDPCGVPFVIEDQEAPGFEADSASQAATEFHVLSSGCPQSGTAVRNRNRPLYPRSY